MAQHDILGRNAEKDMGVRVRNLSTATPLASTSVTNGHTEFNGNESLLVKGSQKVSGWLIVTGTLKLVGSLLMEGITSMTGTFTAIGTVLLQGVVSITGPNTTITGPFHVQGATDITGDTTVTGPFHVSGNQDNTGTLTVKGATRLEALVTLLNNLVVSTGGKITAGDLTITPTGELSSPSNLVVTTPRMALSADLRVVGSITNTGIASTSNSANAYINLVGELQKVGSAARLKIDPEPMDLPDSLLDVPVEHWIDLGDAERIAELYTSPRPFTESDQMHYDGADLTRIAGVIAQKVKAAGGNAFVTYDEAGEIQGVAYDRFALARTAVLSRQVEALRAEIAAMKA